MARGLSKHQKKALVMAYENFMSECSEPHLYKKELMSEIYGITRKHDRPLRKSTGQTFIRDDRKKYNTAQAQLTRVLKGLENRGYAVRVRGRNWSGINLTRSGYEFGKIFKECPWMTEMEVGRSIVFPWKPESKNSGYIIRKTIHKLIDSNDA